MICYRCGQEGHYAAHCPQKPGVGVSASTFTPVQPNRGGYQGNRQAELVVEEVLGERLDLARVAVLLAPVRVLQGLDGVKCLR